MAQILGTHSVTGEEASAVAGAYLSWVNETISAVSARTSGYALTSLYIAGWDADAAYTLSNTHGVSFPTGLGLAYPLPYFPS